MPFYDATEPLGDAPVVLDDIVDDFDEDAQDDCDDCGAWMGGKFVGDFESFYRKSRDQKDDDLYIDQFIDLINFVESENEYYTIDVIYCVNILSESASEMIDVIDYLLLEGINVIGVELGNEVYFEFQQVALGFIDFDHYWQYINGIEDYSTEFPLDDFDNLLIRTKGLQTESESLIKMK